MSHYTRWCFVASLLLLGACMPADEQPKPNTHLPGFDLWMPKGVVDEHGSHPAIGSCDSGDLVACQQLIELIQVGNAAGNVMSLESARARACSLGDRNHCA